jgi:hypothetical protein
MHPSRSDLSTEMLISVDKTVIGRLTGLDGAVKGRTDRLNCRDYLQSAD